MPFFFLFLFVAMATKSVDYADISIAKAQAEVVSAEKDVNELAAEQSWLTEQLAVNKRRRKEAKKRLHRAKDVLALFTAHPASQQLPQMELEP